MTVALNYSRIMSNFIQMSSLNVEKTIKSNCKSFATLPWLPWQPKIRKSLFYNKFYEVCHFSLEFWSLYSFKYLHFFHLYCRINCILQNVLFWDKNGIYFDDVIKKHKNRKNHIFGKKISKKVFCYFTSD